MIESLIKGIFSLILQLFNILLSPIISLVFSLFPDVSVLFAYVNQFLDVALTNVTVVLNIFVVPRGALILLFDYYIICYTIYYSVLSIKFIITVYNKFKT